MKGIIDKVINIGVKKEYLPWEIYLTRKLNSITLIGLFNFLVAFAFFLVSGYREMIIECLFVFVLGPIVIWLNYRKNYVWAAYLFYLMGYSLFLSMNLKMGKESLMILFYFPVIISLVQLLGRKETIKHLIILSGLCLVSIAFIAVGFKYSWLKVTYSEAAIQNLAIMNVILCFFTAITFVIVVVLESLSQERKIESMLTEKEVLLAEVFHRVKNNMNIVTSLLNLKKNMSDSAEVQTALEECKNRVYSMALVHHKLFNQDNVVSLNFKDYINELVKDLVYSIGGEIQSEVVINADNVNINLSNAIPCGLILNELITNSFKYAGTKNRKLKIEINLAYKNNEIELLLKDNGPGLDEKALNKSNTLGIELIKSLSDQIDGKYGFENDKGLKFWLRFHQDQFS